ncbi:MAG: M48 family metalloprotease [Gemmataceae bacterium]|nr:M48 family metalloprotease [Gemmataceae bacterium]
MPILVVLILTAACARVPWPEPPFGFGGSGSLALTAFAFLLPIGAAIVLSRWAAAAVRHEPGRRLEIVRTYSRYRRLLGYANLFIAALAIAGLGWGWTVWHRAVLPADRPVLAPMAELLVPAPYLVAVFAVWIIHYDAERAFHATAATVDHPFWSRAGHFLFQLRPFAFLVLLPVVLFAAQQTFARMAPEAANSWYTHAGSVLMVPVLFVGMPLLLKPALGLKPMPPGPTRDRLEELARRFDFRCADLLHWPTRGQMVNAMVVGLVPKARYVVFTDRLMETLSSDEVDAVFGHEVGHAKHYHIPFYVLFFILSAVAVTGLAGLGMVAAAEQGWIDAAVWEPWAGLPPLAALIAHIFLFFGHLSRVCERQADLYGCRAAAGDRITPEGIDAMIRALERVADLGGETTPASRPSLLRRLFALLRSWQHGSIDERIRFLRRVLERPELERRFQRRAYWLKWAIVAAHVGAIVAIGSYFGWREVAKAM